MARKANKVEVKCSTCGKPKIITERAFNDNKTKRFYCNSECRANDKFKQVTVICEKCKKEFSIHKSQYDRSKKKKFCCSRECLASYKNIILVCGQCEKEFVRKEYENNKTNGGFCSRECYLNSIKNKVETNCSQCGKGMFARPEDLINKQNLYCSRKCLHQWQSENWNGSNHPSFSQVEVKCDVCGKNKLVTRAISKRHKRFFCSDECFSIGVSGPGSSSWLGGLSFGEYSYSFNKRLKKYIKERDGYRCQICGERYNREERNLCAHHINYDKQDSDEENLITLCRRCHAKTNKNREVWERWFNSSSAFWFAARSQ